MKEGFLLLEPSWLSWGGKIVRDIWMEATENAFGGGIFHFPAPFPLTKYPSLDTLGFPESVVIM